jgi:plasmid replication initiation protein
MNPIDPLAALEEQCEMLPMVAGNGKMVVHANALSLARYRFTTHAQKLLFLLIAHLDQSEDHLKVQLRLTEFADSLGYDHNDVTFNRFVETAEELMGKFIVVKLAPPPGEKQPMQLICHWISSQKTNPNDKTITFSFDADLKPHLLRLKHNFVSYPYIYLVNLDTSYAMRLYDTLKAFQYRNRPQEFAVSDLRQILGTTEFDGQGRVTSETLQRYFDFKRVAINPAVHEINAKSDLLVSYREVKKPGSKSVHKIIFDLRHKQGLGTYDIITLPKEPQIELPLLAPVPKETQQTVDFDKLRSEFGLNPAQLKKIAGYLEIQGHSYVLEKVRYTREQKEKQRCENPTAFLLAALRDDYKTNGTIPKRDKAALKSKSKLVVPRPEPLSDEEWKLRKQMATQMKERVSHIVGREAGE